MTSKLRVGVVGVGYLGKFHARIYSTMEDVELAGVADIDGEAAETVAKEYACTAYTDPLALVDKVDAISIVVPTSLHLQVAQPYLENGVHMMLEKPIAHTVEEGEKIVSLAKKHNAILQIGHLERYNAGVRALIKEVESARFIEAHRLGTFVERATDVDVVTDLMIHDIDIVMALVNSPIKDIAAVGIPVLTDHADIANARLEFENGAVANVTASRVSNKRFRRIRVFAKAHYYGLNYADQQLETVAAEPAKTPGSRPNIVSNKIDIEPAPPLDAELMDFVVSVRAGAIPEVDGNVGLEALRIALLVKEKIAACMM
ncbi:MAG: Gfo/Idh/MocA family oxidoreductase [Gammaproteobacteria bacterium]|nr:MAG: Gfo/Idh/MocA family oxidoreductase [Gammaproteobacteria bacterium]